MSQPWSAEFAVSDALARSLIEAQFPQLAPVNMESFGAGWDNSAFRVNGMYVFRFPRRQVAVPWLEVESRVLPVLAGRLSLPVPNPTFVGRPTDAYPWPFAGYPLLPGRTACAAALDDNQRAAAAGPLARFLAALHAVPAAGCGAGPDMLARLDLARRLPQARERLEVAARGGLVADSRPFTRILDTAPGSYTPRADTLVHGDLYVRHLLVDADNQLAGVIDWGDVHLGDPAADLIIAHSFLPPAAQDAFRRAYGPIDDISWRVARLRALWHTIAVLLYGADTGDNDLRREAELSLRYLAAAC
jgi:aminoglycoside phosphotransferase (APT) family kinase protein